ncbi:31666_t:CDS:1, partial [Gigaspora margarita]
EVDFNVFEIDEEKIKIRLIERICSDITEYNDELAAKILY